MNAKTPKKAKFSLSESLDQLANDNYHKQHILCLASLDDDTFATVWAWWATLANTTRLAILAALVKFGDKHIEVSFHELGVAVFKDAQTTPELRAQAIYLLNIAGDSTLVTALVPYLHINQPEPLRLAAADSLALAMELAAMNALPQSVMHHAQAALHQAYQADRDNSVLAVCIAALGFGDLPEPDINAIVAKAYHSGNTALHDAALLAMGRTGDIGAWEGMVLDGLEATNTSTLAAAINAASDLGLETALVPLNTLLHATTDIDLIEHLVTAMSEIGGEQARLYLVEYQALHEDNEAIDEIVEEALFNLDLMTGDFDLGIPNIPFNENWHLN